MDQIDRIIIVDIIHVNEEIVHFIEVIKHQIVVVDDVDNYIYIVNIIEENESKVTFGVQVLTDIYIKKQVR